MSRIRDLTLIQRSLFVLILDECAGPVRIHAGDSESGVSEYAINVDRGQRFAEKPSRQNSLLSSSSRDSLTLL
jgi:hypothetical protein